MDSNLRKRIERLEASEGSGTEAKVRAATEKFAGDWDVDLATRPGAREFLEGEFRAGRLDLDGGFTWEEFVRVFDRLSDLARGSV